MKRTLTLLLAILMGISMVACGGREAPDTLPAETPAVSDDAPAETPAVSDDNALDASDDTSGEDAEEEDAQQEADAYFEVGEEVRSDNFVFTLNEIGFADSICIEKGDSLGLASKTGDAVMADEGYGWLYYSVSYKLTGTEKLPAQGQFLASVQYGEHYFMTPNLRFFKYDGAWHGLDYQWGSQGAVGLPLPASDVFYKYDPWVEKDYELHGAVQVPKKAIEDAEYPLVFRFHFSVNGDASEKLEHLIKIEAPAEPTADERLLSFTYEDREFFKEYVAELTPMTEDEILSVLKGASFSMRNNYGSENNGVHSITFFEDGTLDAGYTYEGGHYTMYESWVIKDGAVVLSHSYTSTSGEEKTSEYILTPYQYDDTRYLLMQMDSGDYSMVLTTE